MARGLTLLTIRRNGEHRLGVKTDKGILDTPAAAQLLQMHSPATMDSLLQDEDGPSLNALVNAALESDALLLCANDLPLDRASRQKRPLRQEQISQAISQRK